MAKDKTYDTKITLTCLVCGKEDRILINLGLFRANAANGNVIQDEIARRGWVLVREAGKPEAYCCKKCK